MKTLRPGEEVFIRVRLVRQAHDDRPLGLRGWQVGTLRGGMYVDPEDIFEAPPSTRENIKKLEGE